MAMAMLKRFSAFHYSNYFRNKLPVRRICSTRRLLSQDWQQEGIPGSNLPFNISNKYKFTLFTTLYSVSGFGAAFILFGIALKRIYTPQPVVGTQVLTTLYCPDGAEVK